MCLFFCNNPRLSLLAHNVRNAFSRLHCATLRRSADCAVPPPPPLFQMCTRENNYCRPCVQCRSPQRSVALRHANGMGSAATCSTRLWLVNGCGESKGPSHFSALPQSGRRTACHDFLGAAKRSWESNSDSVASQFSSAARSTKVMYCSCSRLRM